MTEHHLVPIGELVESPDTWNPARVDGDTAFTYIDLAAVDQTSKVIAAPRQVLASEAPSRARQVVERRDVLVSTVRPNLNAVAVVPTSLDKAIASTGFCVLRPIPNRLDSSYLFHWVKTPEFVGHMVRRATGASYPAVSDRIVRSSEIPLPPLPEQHRIAAILDQADELSAKRQTVLVELETLTTSLFTEMFGNPTFNPKGWPVVRLNEAVELVQIGPFGSLLHQSDYIDGGVPVINPMHIVNSQIHPNPGHSVARDHIERLHNYVLRRGDIVMGRRGDMGRCAVVGPEEDGMLCGSGSLIIRPDVSRATSDYLQALLSSAHFIRTLEHEALGVTMLNLNSTIVEGLRLPLPNLDEQLRYGKIMERLSYHQRRVVDSAADIDQLRASLQHRAFRGEL